MRTFGIFGLLVILLLLLNCCWLPKNCCVSDCCISYGVGLGGTNYGYATWYGKEFNGRRTASGEIYDMFGLTAASRTLPFGTKVRITNLENNRSVVVRINDRGPVPRKYCIDLSYGAAKEIGLVERGVVKVRLETLH
jgi:rare lipoprotein A